VKTEAIPDAPTIVVQHKSALAFALAEAAELSFTLGPVPLPPNADAQHLNTQYAVFKQTADEVLEDIPRLGDVARERAVRQLATLLKQIRETLPLLAEARKQEAEAEQRKREAEAVRQDEIMAEMQELRRLKRIAFGLD
jgi:hypothetical protein